MSLPILDSPELEAFLRLACDDPEQFLQCCDLAERVGPPVCRAEDDPRLQWFAVRRVLGEHGLEIATARPRDDADRIGCHALCFCVECLGHPADAPTAEQGDQL